MGTNNFSEKIVIIGAGAAGIATASRLLKANITDFIIIEAEDRIGGRIHSLQIGDTMVDLGAQYVHGEKGNIVYELASDYIKHDNDTLVTYYCGQRKSVDNLLDTIIDVHDYVKTDDKTLSIGERYLSRFNTNVLPKYQKDPNMLEYAKNFVHTAEVLTLNQEGSFSWLKIADVTNYENCPGDYGMSWDGKGYKTILDILMKDRSINKTILFKKIVSEITLNDESVKISCSDGTQIEAKHVVFTPSLGVLRRDHLSMFKPKLDDDKQTVIAHTGFDAVMKVIIEFPEEWCRGIQVILVWSEDEKRKLKEAIPYGPIIGDDHWLSWFNFVGPSPKNPRVLIGWFVGPMVPEIEKLPNDQLKNGTMYALRTFLSKDFNIPEPTAVIGSQWYNNPFYRGSYSYETVKLRNLNVTSPQVILQRPILGKNDIPRILFAGEATSPKRHSTVDGAIESGFREAKRLIDLIKE